jgi:acetylcholinesterase
LFVGAIGESPYYPTQPKLDELEWQFEDYVNATGCGGTTDELDCLRSLNTSVLQAANGAFPYRNQPGATPFYFAPAIDGDLIADYPYLMFERGKFIDVPTIFGATTDEVWLFLYLDSYPSNDADRIAREHSSL